MLAQKILTFLSQLQIAVPLPADVAVLNPFSDDETKKACTAFYNKYYSDDRPRHCIIGINPGRFGGGVTGIPFTDPIRLQQECGIETSFAKKQELSSVFIYNMIQAYGGVTKFYGDFYFTAVSPLGFTRHGKNLNYYDDKALQQAIEPFAVSCLQHQLSWGLNNSVAYCLGEGTNYKFLSKLNERYNFFNSIQPLPHPRFIMQYRLKTKEAFIRQYVEALHNKH